MIKHSHPRREKRSAAPDSAGDNTRRPRKRERYTRIACESCKSRKVKCSGNLPCSRCSELNVECAYNEYLPQLQCLDNGGGLRRNVEPGPLLEANPSDLGQLLATLKKTCDQIQQTTSTQPAPLPPNQSLARQRQRNEDTEFKDTTCPSNFAHWLNMARSVLEKKGVLSVSNPPTPNGSISKDNVRSPDIATVLLQAARPVLDIGYEAATQCMTTFELEIYPLCPCINLEFARQRLDALFRLPSLTPKGGLEDEEVDIIDVEMAKAVIAIATLVDGGENPMSSDLMSHLLWTKDQGIKQESAQVEDVIIASLLTIYFILKDEEVKSWRMAGSAAKSCFELGMHKISFYKRRNGTPAESGFLGTLFSCVYDLDKRCSFYTNLPWTLHDKAIDETVLDIGPRHPFLSAMIALNRIHVEIIELFNKSAPENKESDERAEYLDFRVQKLVEGIPQAGLFPSEPASIPQGSRQMALKALFELRTNHIRMLAHIPALCSAQALINRPRSARTLIDLARSTVKLHAKTILSGGVSRFTRPILDKVLMGSVACMFLAASYDPDEYGPTCSQDFHSALDALTQSNFHLSGLKSRFWCTLEDLRSIGQSIRMPRPEQSPTVLTSASVDGLPPGIGEMQRQFVEGDFMGSFDVPEDDLLVAVFGDSYQGGSSSSLMGNYMFSNFDQSALPANSWLNESM